MTKEQIIDSIYEMTDLKLLKEFMEQEGIKDLTKLTKDDLKEFKKDFKEYIEDRTLDEEESEGYYEIAEYFDN